MRFISDDVTARDIDVESPRPKIVVDVTTLVRRHKNAGRYDDSVDAAICQHHILEQTGYALAISDVARKADRRTTVADSSARHANAWTILVNNLLCCFLRRRFVKIDADDVGALFH